MHTSAMAIMTCMTDLVNHARFWADNCGQEHYHAQDHHTDLAHARTCPDASVKPGTVNSREKLKALVEGMSNADVIGVAVAIGIGAATLDD